MPSVNLLLGYKVTGNDWAVKDEDSMIYTGLSLDWPIGKQIERAEYEVSKIEKDKRDIINKNTYLELYTNLKNLNLEIQREDRLIKLASEKIKLAESILKDESENYSFGKITLNDYISAVNSLDENKFNKILHTVEQKKLLTEWLRMTDQLVKEKLILGK